MNIPQYIYLIGSVLVAAVGVSVIYHMLEVFAQQRSGREQQLPGGTFKFRDIISFQGGRSLMVFLFGILLLIAPLYFAVQLLTPTLAQAESVHTVPRPEQYEERQKLDEPYYGGLHILSYMGILDLRSRKVVQLEEKDKEISPATWTRYLHLEKLSGTKNEVELEFATSGVDIHARCLTHSCEVLKSQEPHYHGDTSMKSTWHVRADIASVDRGSDFLLVADATYWNAFTGKDREWAAISAPEEAETDEIGIIILFPKDKPFKAIRVRTGPHKTRDLHPFEGQATILSKENNHVYMWRIEKPRTGYTYQLEWDW